MLIETKVCYKVQTIRWRLTQKITFPKARRKITNGNDINKLNFVRQNNESKKRFILPKKFKSYYIQIG